jgi:AraC-like DNA-binding protein
MDPLLEDLFLNALGWERANPARVLHTFSRSYYRFHFVTAGAGYLKTVGETLRLSEGQGFLIFPGDTPSYFPDKNAPWEYFWAAIEGSRMDRLVEAAGLTRTEPVFQAVCSPEEMRGLLSGMCAISIMPQAADRVFPVYLDDFFSKIVSVASPRRSNSQYFEQCLAYVDAHFAEHITVQDIAASASIDRTYLFKLFRKNLGISPQRYLIDCRIAKACEYLRSTNLTIAEISDQVGFRDFSDFSRQFKARRRMSPSGYRRMGG